MEVWFWTCFCCAGKSSKKRKQTLVECGVRLSVRKQNTFVWDFSLLFLVKLDRFLESICCADHYVTLYLAGPSATCPPLNDLGLYLSNEQVHTNPEGAQSHHLQSLSQMLRCISSDESKFPSIIKESMKLILAIANNPSPVFNIMF